MQASQGIPTSRGGLVSHAAVVAHGWVHPGRRGCREREDLGQGLHRRRGDGGRGRRDLHRRHHRRGGAGRGGLSTSEAPLKLETLPAWPTASAAARVLRRARLGVRANADTGADATRAWAYGAEGIGLCRTEHMFLGDDRLPVVREMILADTPEAEEAALDKLLAVQRADFVEVLEAMDGLPVTVRLLDPPLHEFLPQVEDRGPPGPGQAARATIRACWRPHGRGTSRTPCSAPGVRLGVVKPGLYAMQVQGRGRARSAKAGGRPVVEIMIPLTVTREEMALRDAGSPRPSPRP